MKLLDLENLRTCVFTEFTCKALVDELDVMHPDRWFFRSEINSTPTEGTRTANYYFLGDKQQPKDFNERLRGMAPVLKGYTLAEACVNRYDPGGFMPEHIDTDMYRINMVIPLETNPQAGMIIRHIDTGVSEFVCDQAGHTRLFGITSPPHRVPPVKNRRYVVIYLYE